MTAPRESDVFRISSDGDLEIAILHENQVAFADIINPDLYAVLGESPEQNILFHNDACFDLFLVHVAEVFAEGTNNVVLDGRNYNFSLFGGALWLCEKYEEETRRAGLTSAYERLNMWLSQIVSFTFWCGGLNTQFELNMSRRDLLGFASNLSKHNILRLNALLNRLQRLCERSGFTVSEADLLSIMEPFVDELRSRLMYHSSYLTEMLYDYFAAINKLITDRFDSMGTNDVSQMRLPDGVTSDSYRDLYGSTLVFRRYDEGRFNRFKPITSPSLKIRY